MKTLLSGKKTYLTAAVMAVYAASAFWLGNIDGNAMTELLLAAMTIVFLRLGIMKSGS